MRLRRCFAAIVSSGIVAAATLAGAAPGSAAFAGTTSNATSSFGADTLAAPTGFGTTPLCHLSWTATSSTWATGYKIERWRGVVLEQTFTVDPATATSYDDSGLIAGTYTWKIWAYLGTWTSSVASASATVVLC